MKYTLSVFILCLMFSLDTTAQINLLIASKNASPGHIVSVPVHLDAGEAVNLLGFQFTINWNAQDLSYESLSNFGINSLDIEDFGTPEITDNNNSLSVVWEDYPNAFTVDDNTLLFYINFMVSSDFPIGSSSEISLCNDCMTEFYDEGLASIDVIGQNGEVFVSTLPIELSEFKAALNQENQVILNWTSVQESNNSHFEIEHSLDFATWQSIGKVEGAGTSYQQKDYQWIDYQAHLGENYYRLKQVDVNDNFKYLDIQQVILKEKASAFSYMNPFQDDLTIEYAGTQDTDLQLTVYNAIGQFLQAETFAVQEGSNKFAWNLSTLPSGIYYVKTNGEKDIFKVVKE